MRFTHPYQRENITYNEPKALEVTKKTVEDFTETIKNKLGYKIGYDIEPIIEKLGGKIIYLKPEEFDETEGGSILIHGQNDFEIFLSSFTSILRNRFTIAHELGHYFLHSNQGEIPIHVERYGSTKVEWEANWFSASFLMPKNEIEKEWEKLKDIYLLSNRFLVSTSAISIRLKALGIN